MLFVRDIIESFNTTEMLLILFFQVESLALLIGNRHIFKLIDVIRFLL